MIIFVYLRLIKNYWLNQSNIHCFVEQKMLQEILDLRFSAEMFETEKRFENLKQNLKKLYGLFLSMGFNCLKYT